MKLLFALITLLCLSACSANRVLVRDCQKLEGIDLYNCELMKTL